MSAAVMLLADIRAIMSDPPVERIMSVDLVRALVAMEDRPWPEWKRGHPITTVQMARLLARFEIKPRAFRVDTHTTAKGYRREALNDAFSRYLPDPTVTRSQPNETGAYSENPSVTAERNVTDGKCPKPAEINECNRVTDEKGGTGDEWGMDI